MKKRIFAPKNLTIEKQVQSAQNFQTLALGSFRQFSTEKVVFIVQKTPIDGPVWMGWFGFNGASGSIAGDGNSAIVSRTLVNTTISSSICGIVTVLLFYWKLKFLSVIEFCNGILAGLVSITAGCNAVEDWAAFSIGFIGAVVYFSSTRLLKKFGIDDAIYASCVHGFCGVWGVLATGLFNMEDGWFYSGKTCFGWQCIGTIAIVGWAAFWTFAICKFCEFFGFLKYSKRVQDEGIDMHIHVEIGGSVIESVNEGYDDNFGY